MYIDACVCCVFDGVWMTSVPRASPQSLALAIVRLEFLNSIKSICFNRETDETSPSTPG